MPFDPGYETGKDDDCMRRCIAYYLNKHPSKVKYIEPDTGHFWEDWKEYLEKYNIFILFYEGHEGEWMGDVKPPSHINYLKESDAYWIAVVDSSYTNDAHAVVMKGKKLVYDPAGARTAMPRKIYYGFQLLWKDKIENAISSIG